MKSAILIIGVLIFAISFACALKIGISSEKLDFSGEKNEIICRNFSVFGDSNDLFKGTINWSRIESRNIYDYNLSSDKLKINSTFPLEINPGKYQICISSRNSGNYYGVLMYKLQNSSYGVGTWIELRINRNSLIEKISLASGKAIKNMDDNAIKFGFLSFSTVLLVIFLILVMRLRRKRIEKLC